MKLSAIVYGELRSFPHSLLFHGDTTGDMVDVPLVFYAIESEEGVTLFDCGASEDWATHKGVAEYVQPGAALAEAGYALSDVTRVVLSHLHWDHASGLAAFSDADVVVQRLELDGWTRALSLGLEYSWIHSGRVDSTLLSVLGSVRDLLVVDGDIEIYPGLSCRLAPGHTFGTQFLQVDLLRKDRTEVVFASDVAYTQHNLEAMVPPGNGFNQIEMLESMFRVKDLVTRGNLVIPGHDWSSLRSLEKSSPHVYAIR